jgi:hypothetical protein
MQLFSTTSSPFGLETNGGMDTCPTLVTKPSGQEHAPVYGFGETHLVGDPLFKNIPPQFFFPARSTPRIGKPIAAISRQTQIQRTCLRKLSG